MLKKIILAIIIVTLLVLAWRIFSMCKTGSGGGLITDMFAWVCHLFYRPTHGGKHAFTGW